MKLHNISNVWFAWALVAISATTLFAEPETDVTESENLSLRQQHLAEQFRHFDAVLEQIARLTEATDPRRAALMRKARQQIRETMIEVRLDSLVDQLRRDKLSTAIENQKIVDQDLRNLLELLMSEDRAKRIASEKARIRNYLKRINRIIRKQKDVRGRTAGGGNSKGLAKEQDKLAKDTGRLAKDVKKNEEGSDSSPGKDAGKDTEQKQNENPVRKRLESAKQRMKNAQEKLDRAQREGAVDKQEEAIAELERAKAELEEILRQLREEEIARMLTMLEARFRKMLAREREVYQGTVRLDKVPKQQWSHNHEIESSRLSGRQQQIVVDADNALVLLREDGTAVAFPEAVEQMREDMQQVVRRLAMAKVGRITQAVEEDIIAALEEMIEALKKAQEDLEEGKPKPPGTSGPPQEPPLVDMLAELKMIRALQMRVNRRTKRYSLLCEDEQVERQELLDALGELAERQRRIYRVTRDLELGKNK